METDTRSAALLDWVRCFHPEITDLDDLSAERFQDIIGSVAPDLADDDWKRVGAQWCAIARHICRFCQIPCCSSLEIHGSNRISHVQAITGLSAENQAELMGIIQDVIVRIETAGTEDEDSNGDSFKTPRKKDTQNLLTPTPSKRLQKTPSNMTLSLLSPAIDSAAFRRLTRENAILKEENDNLKHDISSLDDKVKALGQRQISFDNELREEKLQAELLMIQKEQELTQRHEGQIRDKQREIDELQSAAHRLDRTTAELTALKDEIDVLRPTAEKAQKLEALLNKYKLKLESAGDVTEQLKRVEIQSRAINEENYRLSEEVKRLPIFQKKVEEYKAIATDCQIRMSEMKAQLSSSEQEALDLREKLREVEQHFKNTLKEREELIRNMGNLQDRSDGIEGSSTANAVGGGISELNPELNAKLIRLEQENARLLTERNENTSDTIDRLHEELDDMGRLKTSFEQKYLTTKAALEKTQDELGAAKAECDRLQEALKFTKETLDAKSLLLETQMAENEQLRCRNQNLEENIAQLQIKLQEECDLRLQETVKLKGEVQSMQDIHERYVVDKTQEIQDLCAAHQKEHETLSSDYHDERERLLLQHQREVEQILQQLAQTEKEAKESTMALDLRWSQETAALVQQHKEELEKNHIQHEALVAEKLAEISVLKQEINSWKEQHSVSNDEHELFVSEMKQKMNTLEETSKATIEGKDAEFRRLEKELSDGKQLFLKMKEKHKAESARLNESINFSKSENLTLRKSIAEQLEQLAAVEEKNNKLEQQLYEAESKRSMVEKERNHLAKELSRLRESGSDFQTLDSQATTQLKIVRNELQLLHEQHRQLQKQIQDCTCRYKFGSDRRGGDVDDIVSGYVDSLRQMELTQKREEEKRRELVMINAKLTQENKVIALQHNELQERHHKLQDQLNSLMLREERRKKLERENINADSNNSEDSFISGGNALDRFDRDKDSLTDGASRRRISHFIAPGARVRRPLTALNQPINEPGECKQQ